MRTYVSWVIHEDNTDIWNTMFFPNKAVDDITITSSILCFPGRIPMNVVKCYVLNWQKNNSAIIWQVDIICLHSQYQFNSYCLESQLETVSFKNNLS